MAIHPDRPLPDFPVRGGSPSLLERATSLGDYDIVPAPLITQLLPRYPHEPLLLGARKKGKVTCRHVPSAFGLTNMMMQALQGLREGGVHGGYYYLFHGGTWFYSGQYNGPWVALVIHQVPRPILSVPVTYYRIPPGHAKKAGPPPWAGPGKGKSKHKNKKWKDD